MSVAGVFAQANLVQNGDFEEWNFSNGNPKYWDGRHPSVLVEESNDPQSGAKSAKMEIDDFSYGVGYMQSSDYKIALEAGKTYQCSFYYKITSGDFTQVSMSLQHTPNIWPEDIVKGEATEHALNTWHKVEFTHTETEGKSADVYLYTRTSDKVTILIDNVIVQEASTNGISTESTESSFKIYPNPAIDYITVDNNTESVSIYDLSGRLVKQVNTVSNTTVDVASLAKGTYIVSTVKEGKTLQSKLIKQ